MFSKYFRSASLILGMSLSAFSAMIPTMPLQADEPKAQGSLPTQPWEITLLGGVALEGTPFSKNYIIEFSLPNSEPASPNYRIGKWQNEHLYYQGAFAIYPWWNFSTSDQSYKVALIGAGYSFSSHRSGISPFLEGEFGLMLAPEDRDDSPVNIEFAGTAGLRYFIRTDLSLRGHIRTYALVSEPDPVILRAEIGIGLSVFPGAK